MITNKLQKINNDNHKYYLGLDIGIGSVGWGIIGEAKNGEHWLEDFGVRLFQVPEDPQNKKSWAEKRREFRGKRRLLNRWHCRREELKKFFGKIFGDNFLQEFENFVEKKKPTNLLEYDETKFFNPYIIRYWALSSKISQVELLFILFHISKYRGYKSFYLDDNPESKDEDAKKTYAAVGETKRLFRENNYRSVAEMVIKNEKFRHSQYKNLLSPHNHNPNKVYENKEEAKKNHKHFIFPRELLTEETEKILEKQSEYHPQLKRNYSYISWENGNSKTKEFSAQEIVKRIIFRQRDFEDGPTKLEPKNLDNKKAISHWKKHNRNIASKSFTEMTGYCQYFPTEKRGWCCSFIYCCYQFVNEFSKIGNLEEKELGGLEKVKEIHQQVFEWLISPSGYQPKTLSQEEKKSGKKRETFRKQLENFLNELVGKENYSFSKGIEFKTGFLDYLKENSSFYSTLMRSCSSRFYLSYEDYQKTIFYQIGQIIFEKITPQRRKNELDSLSKKVYSLEVFRGCLAKLEKYDKERSPASVSFRYMIEAIKAFLDGQKYGEFQAETKKELEEKLKSSKNSDKNKKIWSPQMDSDLVTNPVVFRSFNQTRKILKNLFLNYPQGFATINIETGRDLWNSEEERGKIERKNRDQAKEKQEIVEKLKDSNSDIEINEENVKRYRLWEDQNEKLWGKKKRKKEPTIKKTTNPGGICLYCGQEIDLWKLKNTEIDHIIPQSKWANDSFNNLTLTHPECNQKKGENLPFHFFDKYKTKKEWLIFKKRVDNTYKTRNPFKHKFLTLGEKEGWEEELEVFVSRNLNDTRHVAIRINEYIKNQLNKNEKFQETKVQLIKGSLTSYFRKQLLTYKEREGWRFSAFYYKDQLRSLTSYHHAIDAIVLAHFKSRGYIQLLEDLTKISRSKLKLKRQKITQEQFDILVKEIIKKWKRSEWELKKYELLDEYTKNAVKILEDVIQQKEINISEFFPISNLKNIIEQRIPIQLEKNEKDPDWNQEEKKEIKEVIIEVKKVLTEDEYQERIRNDLEDQRGNIHYPYISYVSDHKVKKEIIASERAGYRKKGEEILPDICEKLRKNEKIDLPKNISLSKLVEKVGLEKLNSEYGEKYNFLVVKDKQKENNYTIWDTSKYAGFGVRKKGKSERIKNIELLSKKRERDRKWLIKNYEWLLRPYESFTFNYSENLESELMKLVGLPLVYTGTTKDNVSSIDIVGLVYDKKENLQTIYPEHSDKIINVKNTINSLGTGSKSIKKISPSIKLLKISVLGKREK
ncbi:MAG: type II CRISPR RNA-guided endonuclease Cas9 [Candidatus Moeniiplasma glomeromycotorum]|nr:type II CRISPR RNA-guided endonuclease Cas9 [Candidatus Moeniiplasma glomeromycotorum]MCE8162219.1 type II CRISPR RNA-guided endonuclease Cas9 [Candidatus Moeniiplasma glomeromycotorum]MCE8166125.1 type II CRISPR RNA-guided endonuclease Cas9 [Candidatus Moeniiplasma glomeromycotorum]MCE8166618.1 type II CRISPR RNA-guided endonuclease Cas9 [Candidatus Moeniiplasma glomeromycotorum]